jgi:signal peptide peptidase SppA
VAGKLLRLTQKIVDKPQLMYAPALESVLQILTDRNSGLHVELAVNGGRERKAEELSYNPDTKVGLLSIDGPLTYLEYEPMCGVAPSSYQRLSAEFSALVNSGAKTIVLDMDTPGGEAYACFETAQQLRKMADDAGVKILAYVDGMAASAGYGLACIADEIIVNPMAEVGSIGVVVGLTNYSEAEKNIGIQRSYVYAGAAKIPFDANGNFTESFLTGIQAKVDSLYGEFVSHVSEARKLSAETVKNTEAKVFTAQEAVALGLADSVMTVAEFQDYLATYSIGNTMSIKSKLFSLTSQGEDMTQLTDLEAQVATLTVAVDASKSELSVSHEAINALTAELTASKEEVATLTASLEEVSKKEEEALAAAQAAALVARKEKLVAAVGEAKGETLFASLSVLDDVAFNSVVETFAEAKTSVDHSFLMEETGIGADGNLVDSEGQELALVGQMISARKIK